MKKVTSNKNTVQVSEVDISKYYGVRCEAWSGFICRQNYRNGKYRVRVSRLLTEGNRSFIDTDSLADLVNGIITNYTATFEVFEFDTPQELYRWLSEQKN